MAHVLVAEDNAVDRKILTTIVSAAGFAVTEAVDGVEALAQFCAVKPDLVLLDALMPGQDGFKVAREIRAASDDFVPIIFLTSLTDASDLARCLEAGGDDFVTKPYNKVILHAKLNAFQRMREMHLTMQSQRDEITAHHMQLLADQEAAKAVFDNVAHSRQLEADNIRYLLSPLALFNGDVFLAGRTPNNQLCALLGDFTGHGLAAAIGAMPLADAFYSMTAKGFTLAELLRECNRKLCSVLPVGNFCCATAMLIDFNRYTVEYWNGALPSAYLRRAKSNDIVHLKSNNLPLGILPAEQFNDETLVVEAVPGDRLFLATDGVVEARNHAKEYFGVERLEEIVSSADPEALFDEVKTSIEAFMDGADDDITMVEIQLIPPPEEEIGEQSMEPMAELGPRDWKLSYELGPSSLTEFNPLPLLQQILMEAPYLRSKAASIYTILSELYSNGLEHGVLGLDSRLKKTADGFAQYYAERAKALRDISGFVRFDMRGTLIEEEVTLAISVTDSGDGFDYAKHMERIDEDGTVPGGKQYHGRGVRLLRDLCEEVEFMPPGNCANVRLRWHLSDA